MLPAMLPRMLGSDSDVASDAETELDVSDGDDAAAPATLSRSQTVYVDSCQRDRQTAQRRILNGLARSSLRLRLRYLGSQAFRPISLALRANDCVTHLDFSCNGMDAEGMLCLAKVLKSNNSVQELNLASNCLGDKGAIAVADLMKGNAIIQVLDVSSNGIGEEGGKFLALGIEENEAIKRLRVGGNGISETGALYIGRALAENFVLEQLDVSWCRIRKVGAVGLCQGARRNVSLSSLNLSWNGFGYEGALALSEMLRGNKYLHQLDVSCCRINWQGAALIAAGLASNTNLRTLAIGGNPLSTSGCLEILEGLTGSDCALTELDLRGNKVTSDFEFLAQAIAAGREFSCHHDGVLPSHDLIGRQRDRRQDPMAKVIEYMQRFQLRPLELFRSFDKDVALRMGKMEFISRLQKVGLTLSEEEVDDVVYQMKKGGDGRTKKDKLKGDINFKKFNEGFRDQRRKERLMKMQEANLQQRLSEYHREILSEGATAQRVSEELGQVSLKDAFFERPKAEEARRPKQLQPLASASPAARGRRPATKPRAKAKGGSGSRRSRAKAKAKAKAK